LSHAQYIPLLIFMVIAILFPLVTLAIARFFRPAKYNKSKLSPYECGIEVDNEPERTFHVRYYVVAVIFLIFDVETVFLYPWAVKYRTLGLFGFVEMAIFLIILIFGYVYAWKKGALEWE
jgi:NADH-quinone oxidoreductase subunit A